MFCSVSGASHFSFRQSLLEPYDIGSQQSAAVRTFRRDIARLLPTRNAIAFVEAFGARDISMKFNHIATARLLMEAIYVLCDKMKLRPERLHFGQRKMPLIRLGLRHQLSPPFIPFPHEARITKKGARRSNLFGLKLGPQSSLRIAEGWHTALGGNARTSEYRDAFGSYESMD